MAQLKVVPAPVPAVRSEQEAPPTSDAPAPARTSGGERAFAPRDRLLDAPKRTAPMALAAADRPTVEQKRHLLANLERTGVAQLREEAYPKALKTYARALATAQQLHEPAPRRA